MKLRIAILGLAGLLLAPGAIQRSGFVTMGAATAGATRLLRATPAQADGEAILQRACTACHDLGGVDEFAASGEEATRDLVSTMVSYGAAVTEDEIDVLVAHIVSEYGGAADAAAFDEEAGVNLLNAKCTTCHDLSSVVRGEYPPEEWAETVDRMMGYGLALSEEEYGLILATLGTAPGQAASGEVAAFDEDAVGALVNTKCTTCHDLSSVVRGEYPPEEWAETVDRMIGYGLALSEDEYDSILTWLGTAPGDTGAEAGAGPAADAAPAFDEAAAEQLVNAKCTTCHDLTAVGERGLYPPEEWAETVDRMMGYGLALTEDEYDSILTWLGTAPGTAAGADDGYDAAAAEALLNSRCTTCHDLTAITSAPAGSFTAQQFRDTIVRMTGYGLSVSEAEVDTLVRYLTETYGAQ